MKIDGFQTDTQISSKNNGEGGAGAGSGGQIKELKEFEFDDHNMHDERLEGGFSGERGHGLEEDGSNGWSPEDMFLMNEKKYAVQSTYKPDLTGYTVQLTEDKSSDEYK